MPNPNTPTTISIIITMGLKKKLRNLVGEGHYPSLSELGKCALEELIWSYEIAKNAEGEILVT